MKKDHFAEIAAGKATNRQQLLAPAPLERPGNVLPLGAAGTEWPEIARLGTQEALERELEGQREAHAPFLRRLAPALNFARKRQTLVRWQWRMETEEDRRDFGSVLAGAGSWEDVTIPHYGGPVGRAVAYYRTEIEVPILEGGLEWTLCFEAADYVARVYCNGRCLGEHEGFFAPFEFSVGAFLIPDAVNTIVVELHNDAICGGVKLADGTMVQGDKLYAATGLGWDDPVRGWHHCPPGMGVFGEVHLEARAHSWVSHAWVRTLDQQGNIEIFLEISGREFQNRPVSVEYAIYGENFEATALEPALLPLSVPEKRGPNAGRDPVGRGPNLYRILAQIPAVRLWEPESPWLYSLQVTLRDGGTVLDARSRVFGVRTFELDASSEPRGRFLLNGRELRLMGANTMGFEQQDVMRGDFDQLRDDMLLAKMCNMNFLRLTQRPVQDAVYDMCDRLGMMTQSDLPLFGVLRRKQFAEGVRQAGDMERMLCPHACNIVVSYINEPFPAEWNIAITRHLTRDELERFFTAADQIVLSINPDRVIKPVDGDYDPPAPGLPDNHCYTLWYVGHGIDAGALHAGHWMPVKPGWNFACGEFGAEGLDFADLMRRRYPAGWLPKAGEDDWTPARIVDAQTGSHSCFFYERPKTLEGWVQASQSHQAFAVRWMTDAFRREKRMVSFAIHLFIDAWPSGWMKTIMDCERRAKPAWFAYRDALSPVHISWRTDRLTCFSGETVPAEIWVANDSGRQLDGAQIRYQILQGERVVSGGCHVLPGIPNADALGVGVVPFHAPPISVRTRFALRALVSDAAGNILHEATASIEVFPMATAERGSVRVLAGFSPDWLPHNLISVELEDLEPAQTVVCSGAVWLREIWPALLRKAHEGARVVVLDPPPGTFEIDGERSAVIEACGMGPRHFVSRDTGHPLVESFQPDDFRLWYDGGAGRITPLLNNLIVGAGGRPVLSSGQLEWGRPFVPADAVREYDLGEGSIILCCLELKSRLANPVAREFLERLIQPVDAGLA
ncbi:MAG: glycoside hydrolase family 2 TIM barrel-domain containing protein [Verrucomicrobiae bacterium]